MTKVIISTWVFALLGFTSSDTGLTKSERAFAVKKLENSRNQLLTVLNGLSEKQLNYKSSSSSWSVAECVEHIAIFENEVFDIIKESLALPASPERRKDIKYSDKKLLVRIADRTKKEKTQEGLKPHRKYGNHDATVKEFQIKRAKHIYYVKTTKDDLRNHFVGFGALDAYQIILYMSAHTIRHIKQIKEIKAHKNFPKK
ncbi:hypothetical protein BKI52_37690 [marine bacterium AO1-C]|nr:hypothetical protein BKI52_37690 [marine bacterium AO1-C]